MFTNAARAAGIDARGCGGENPGGAAAAPRGDSGNRAHPTEKSVRTLKPLIECFCPAGGMVLDPFSGSGSTSVAAALTGRQYLGIELEDGYCAHARRRLAGVARLFAPAAN